MKDVVAPEYYPSTSCYMIYFRGRRHLSYIQLYMQLIRDEQGKMASSVYEALQGLRRKLRLRQRIETLFWTLALSLYPARGEKTISAMMRVRNEAEFLEAAVLSIIGLVNEVVIIDNLSADSTPAIIARLVAAYPSKIRSYRYPYEIARSGQENAALASTRSGMKSPNLLKNFYNFCLSHCRCAYVLKWDGDTIATRALGDALKRFRADNAQVLWHTGANLHENRVDLIAGRPFEDMEPRLFRRRYAKYDNGLGYCEALRTPYLRNGAERFSQHCREPLYVHMKFCKSDRFSNLSEDLKMKEQANSQPGPPAGQDVIETLARWTKPPCRDANENSEESRGQVASNSNEATELQRRTP